MTEEQGKDVTLTEDKSSATKEVTLTQTKQHWTGDNGKDVAGNDISATVATKEKPKGTKVTVTVNANGSVEIKDKA